MFLLSIAVIGAPPWRVARRAFVLVAFALTCLAGARLARAETPARQARDLYEAGLQSYRAGKYDDAISKLEASYQLVAAPGLLYDLAQVHRMKRDCPGARSLYSQFLDRAPGGAVEAIARAHLAEMDRCVADGARARVAATTPASPPVAPPVESTKTPELIAPPLPPPVGVVSLAAAPSRRSRLAPRRSALAVGAAAMGLAAAAGYFAWRADAMSNRVSSSFVPGMEWSAEGMNAQQSGRTSETLGIVAAIGALVCGGIALWLAKRD